MSSEYRGTGATAGSRGLVTMEHRETSASTIFYFSRQLWHACVSLQLLHALVLISNSLSTTPGSKFKIKETIFQDPDFSEGDERFLRSRGHKLIPYPTADTDPILMPRRDYPFDKSLAEHVSPRVFIFAPTLVLTATVDMVLTLNPVLYWGIDVCENLALPYLVSTYS